MTAGDAARHLSVPRRKYGKHATTAPSKSYIAVGCRSGYLMVSCSNAISIVASSLRHKMCEKWIRTNRTNELSILGRNSLLHRHRSTKLATGWHTLVATCVVDSKHASIALSNGAAEQTICASAKDRMRQHCPHVHTANSSSDPVCMNSNNLHMLTLSKAQ